MFRTLILWTDKVVTKVFGSAEPTYKLFDWKGKLVGRNEPYTKAMAWITYVPGTRVEKESSS